MNIIDSVVIWRNFGGGGDVEVNVKESVVHRSDVGGGDPGGTGKCATSANIKYSIVHQSQIGSTSRCPNCGRKVQTDEKF